MNRACVLADQNLNVHFILRELFCVVEKENCSDQPGNHGISVDEAYKHLIFMLRSRNIARDINKNNFGSLLRAAFPGTIVAKKRRVNYEEGKKIAPGKTIHLPNISSCKNRWFQ